MIGVRRAAALVGVMTALGIPAQGQDAVRDTSGHVEFDGAQLFFRTAGEGTPLVIVHGGPGMSHDYLTPQLVELLADEYQLIFYDQRASGRSTGVADTARLTMAQFVRDLEAVRQALNLDRLNLLGHSFGGLLAMYYALEHPTTVGNLVLVDTSPASWQLNFPFFRQAIAARQTSEDKAEMDEIMSIEGASEDPAAMDRYYKVFFRTFFHDRTLSDHMNLAIDRRWLLNNQVTNGKVWQDLGEYDIHDQLGRITAHTLIIHGDASVISIEGAEAIHARIPSSQLIVLKDVGHFPYIESPQAFMAAVKAFLW